MARLAVLGGERGDQRPWRRRLEEAGHQLESAASVELLARRWPDTAYDLLLLDGPHPLLTLHRLQRRLSTLAVPWSRLPVLHLGEASEIAQGDFLLCHTGPPEPSTVFAAVEVLLRLAACLGHPARLPEVGRRRPGALEHAARHLRRQLLATVEQRDAGMPGHAQRVATLASALGRRLGFDSESLTRITEAALWHDIGKLALGPGLLTHTRRLDREERRRVRRHAPWGHALVAALTGDLRLARVVAQHHERRDGGGYLGLAGRQILPEARVIAIAEVWDSLTSPQLYRPALAPARAFEEIRRETWGEELAALEEEVARPGRLTHQG
ncbi:MAG: HD domain-containing protein [Acidobacteriota bacterium]|nr:HD domain-containing protein [Acidobacteriota bacterium]